jgi:hypothetical protein
LFSPPVIWAALAFPISVRQAESQEQALFWAFTYIFLVCILPAVFVGLMVWRGHITDIHMQVRKQRIRPFLVSIICTTIAWWVLRLLGAPPILPAFTLISLAQIVIMLAITLVWQISMHMMSIASAVVAAGVLFGPGGALLTLPLVPVVGAARWSLKRHTMGELVAGGIVGGVMTTLLVLIIQPV